MTSFFRDPDAFDALKKVVYAGTVESARVHHVADSHLGIRDARPERKPIRHAISLMEFLGEQRTEIPVQIFGTDLSENADSTCPCRFYKETIEADVSPVRLRRFFHPVDSGYQISKTIRDLCIFSNQNVFNDPPFSRIDLVSCRNVMIYLSHALQRRVIPIVHYALNPGGFLMIGNTEGLLGRDRSYSTWRTRNRKSIARNLLPTPVTFGFSVQVAEPLTDDPATAERADRSRTRSHSG